ncbi:MAG: hypothetical protein J0L84_09525 [Verrucomicrobia bacterium]|nr:hypothetical protein [Verrucomicrobiota bacterium]
MRLFLILVAWALLLVLCWPLALAVLVLFPLVWLIALPFRLVAVVIQAGFALVRAVLFLPARILSLGRER